MGLGSIFRSSVSLKGLCSIMLSINVYQNYPMKASGPVVFFLGKFVTKNSISFIDSYLLLKQAVTVCIFREFVWVIEIVEFIGMVFITFPYISLTSLERTKLSPP